MFKRQRLLLGVLWVALALAGCIAVRVPVGCVADFEATVRQGPDAGLALVGRFTFTVDGAGGLSGTLTQADGATVPVVGQADGRAIHLAFTLAGADGNSRHIFGVGTTTEDIRTCGGAGGPFVGPAEGDMGDWLAIGSGEPLYYAGQGQGGSSSGPGSPSGGTGPGSGSGGPGSPSGGTGPGGGSSEPQSPSGGTGSGSDEEPQSPNSNPREYQP